MACWDDELRRGREVLVSLATLHKSSRGFESAVFSILFTLEITVSVHAAFDS